MVVGMRRLLLLLGLATSIACVVPPAMAPASRSTASATAAPAQPDPAAAGPTVPLPVSKSLHSCPLATGKHQACSLGLVCTRDRNGCEQCRCREQIDPVRANIESPEPWDTRQQ